MSSDNTSVAILGGGFIGGNLANYLAERGFKVKVIDRSPRPAELGNDNITWTNASIEHLQYLSDTIKGCHTVFHLFSSTVPGDKVSLEQEISNNIYLLSNILDICIAEKVSRFIFMSSASVYGLQGEIPISEKAAPLPISTHGLQKLAMEHLIHIKTRNSALSSKILRLANPYGKGQNLYGRQGFIAIAVGKILRGESIQIRGKGETVRDFIFIDDVMNVCCKLITDHSNDQIFNLGSGQGVSLNQVISEIQSIINQPVEVEYISEREEDIPVSILDISRVQYALGFKPYTSLREGLEKFLSGHGLTN